MSGGLAGLQKREAIREAIYGRQIDLTWYGVKNAGDPGVAPRPMGAARRARCDELDRILRLLDEIDEAEREDT